MTRLLLLASTAFLAACAATPSADTLSSTASVTPAAPRQADPRLAALFEEYNEALLAMSPTTKAYRGIVDEDYGSWSELSDEAEERAGA